VSEALRFACGSFGERNLLVSRPSSRASLLTTLSNITWPMLLGSALSVGFYALVLRGPLNQPVLIRYFAGHPINIVETVLFFAGLVALVLKALDIFSQNASFSGISLPPSEGLQPSSKAADYLETLAGLSDRLKGSYLGKRLIDALESIQRSGSAEGLDAELKYLSDLDAGRQQESYGLVRIIVWAVPMLGFLGTVIGITTAIGDLAKADLVNSMDTAMSGLLSGLFLAFDTTAIALSFALVLMFGQFVLDRTETQLLSEVDARVIAEFAGRFEMVGGSSDPQVQAMHRMAQQVVKATEQLVQRQAEIWQVTIQAAHQQWQKVASTSGEQLQQALATSLERSLVQHAATMAKIEQASAENVQHRWEQWQTVLSDNARLLHAQQQELTRQGELMTRAIQASGEVIKLEHALNQNLAALSGAKNFEDTVMSLAAAIHLLNVRLGKNEAQHVDLTTTHVKGRAA
jgi:biopolymer transport protein ExbB/TolQ